eukprot:CAMPEP_0170136884 /NCGR_PEP_ID=MMETSP0033_2-20121228/3717_1 /TAXON_ID=195969 /ORGANISM="Dolichomastix tenuilepis, Strain CCMP3274" /LENGTH=45 /DNA_ID= /DNA_START= /DNA_END= /DNA_ORIENTATION=
MSRAHASLRPAALLRALRSTHGTRRVYLALSPRRLQAREGGQRLD